MCICEKGEWGGEGYEVGGRTLVGYYYHYYYCYYHYYYYYYYCYS